MEFGGCGELQPRVSNVNKESDQAGQIFRRRMALQQEGGGRNSWAGSGAGKAGFHGQARG